MLENVLHSKMYCTVSDIIDPSVRRSLRRNTDGSAQRRPYTDTTVGAKNRVNEPDTKKRWSNLEERTEVITRNIAELDGKRNPRLSTALKVRYNRVRLTSIPQKLSCGYLLTMEFLLVTMKIILDYVW